MAGEPETDDGGAGAVVALAERAVKIAEQATATQVTIVAQQARSKRTTRWLIVSVALDIGLSIATIALGVSTISASEAIRQSQLNGCAVGNTLRLGQVRLWDHVFSLASPPPHETAGQRKRRLATETAFRVYVRTQFQPVDCARLYR